jgi:DNA-binding beta-propeller fold protein YncE
LVKKDMKVEFVRVWAVRAVAVMALATAAWSGTFGKVVPIGGQASDIALDEGRGVLYIANFTANTIDVMSLADNSISTSINVGPQPGSLALSPDGQFLVVAHFGNFSAPNASTNALTVINL